MTRGTVSPGLRQSARGEVSQHDGGDGDHTGGDAQQERKHRRNQRHHGPAADAEEGHTESQHSIDAGAGDELTEGLGRGLQGNEHRQQNPRPGDPTYAFIHEDSFFPCKQGNVMSAEQRFRLISL